MSNPKKLAMRTQNLSDENYKKLAELFPNAVTETIVGYEPVLDNDGHQVYGLDGEPKERAIVKRAIDKDILEQEINTHVVEGREERYQFTWPDKRKSILLANAPITATLRPVRDDEPAVMKDGEKEIRYTRTGSVNFDNTENLYIEGDNLDVLKLLRETYLNRVKMIYIDPPYNTGNDFVYEDNFAEDTEKFLRRDGQYDEQGNRLVQNRDSNGRFHTDWLNMMYPRLRLARDLLTEDGVIFISIDDNEVAQLRKMCDEVFGASNFRNTILTRRRVKSLNSQFADNGLYSMNVGFEYILVYSKSPAFLMKALRMKKANGTTKGRWDVFWSNANRPTMRYDLLGFTPKTGQWRTSKDKAYLAVKNYREFQEKFEGKMTLEEYSKKTGITEFIRRIPNGMGKNGGVQHWIAPSDTSLRTSNWLDIEVSQIGKEIDLPFDNPKSKVLLMELVKLANLKKNDIVLDFFSGSATTAHAVMQLNAEDGGRRKFIMVQIPEPCPENSEAAKAGYKNICEIGKERIRRAGKKIKEENKDKPGIENLDIGFRVLKLDSSNMKDVYYTPEEYAQMNFELDGFQDNIKEDRTDEDLLFQVMLDLGIPLSAKIRQDGRIFYVEDNYLIACFDKVDMELMTKIAKEQPYYAVFRDSSFSSDSALANFEQVFNTYSPRTERRVL